MENPGHEDTSDRPNQNRGQHRVNSKLDDPTQPSDLDTAIARHYQETFMKDLLDKQ